MTDYNLLDSSIWIDYLINGKHQDLIETEKKLLLATISIIEIIKKLNKLKISKEEIAKKLLYIKKQSILINLDENIADKASQLVLEKNIPVADSVVYASAVLNNAILFTLDNDFRNLSNVKII
ncbi:MAG: PIN domain-containing protein [Candidatus Pacearchaeota archaeon]